MSSVRPLTNMMPSARSVQALRNGWPINSQKPSWPDWTGQTAICMANGPSLTLADVTAAFNSGHPAIAINHVAPKWAPWCDIWYAADQKFWALCHSPHVGGLRVSADPGPVTNGWAHLQLQVHGDPENETFEVGKSTHGQHSGYQALVMAIALGASRVLLLGYDCKPQQGKTHAIEKPLAHQPSAPRERWPDMYRRLPVPAGVEVVNCTAGSAIRAFPVCAIVDAL